MFYLLFIFFVGLEFRVISGFFIFIIFSVVVVLGVVVLVEVGSGGVLG